MRLRLLSSVSVLTVLALSPLVAQAGFEFVSPQQQAPAPAVHEKEPAPLAPIANDKVADETLSPVMMQKVSAAPSFGGKAIPLTPVVRESDALLVSDAPLIPMDAHREVANNMMKAQPAPIAPDTLWDKPVAPPVNVAPVASTMPEAMAPAPMPPANASEKIVQGFGRNVPLVMALQQIVPSNYRYSFGPGIAPGRRIDWQGNDRPWKDVLGDVARRNDLNVDIVSNVVALRQRGPMDIVAPHKVDMIADNNVLGMELKPPAPMSNIPSEDLPPLPAAGPVVADAAPMAIAPVVTPDTMMPPSKSNADLPMPLLPSLADEKPVAPAPVVLAQAKEEKPVEKPVVKTEEKKSFFDNMFDRKKDDKVTADSNNPTPVKDKKILTVDSDSAIAKQDDVALASNDKPDVTWDASPSAAPAPVAAMDGVDLPTATEKDSKSGAPLPLAEPDQKDLPPAPKTERPVLAPVKEKVPVTMADLQTVAEWEAHKGETLRQSLTAWSERAGISVVWSSEYDYPLQTDVRIQSTYPDAVRTLLAGFSKAQPRPLGRLFKNQSTGAQPVLVVETNRLAR